MVDLNGISIALKMKIGFVFQQAKKGNLSAIQQVLVNSGTTGAYISSSFFWKHKYHFWNFLFGYPSLNQNLKNEG